MSGHAAPPDSRLPILVVHADASDGGDPYGSSLVERIREGLARSYNVLACEADLDILLESCGRLNPALLLLDQEFAGGLVPAERARLLSSPVPFLIVGTRDDPAAAAKLLGWGAMGLIRPEIPADLLVEAVEAVRRGEIWLSRAVLSVLVKNAFRLSDARSLTRREAEILDLVSAGLTNQQIADRLCVSRGTIRWHVRGIYRKLGVAGRDAAIQHPVAIRRSFQPVTR